MDPEQVSAVLVTRGDVDLTPILDSLPFSDIVVWDNSKRPVNMKVYGRYLAMLETVNDTIYTQDDDCVCPSLDLVERWDGDRLLVNVPPEETPWMAWGAVCDRWHAWDTHARYLSEHPFDEDFLYWCDVAYAYTAGWERVDLGHEDLPCATAPNRMYHMPDHYPGQNRVKAKASAVRARY